MTKSNTFKSQVQSINLDVVRSLKKNNGNVFTKNKETGQGYKTLRRFDIHSGKNENEKRKEKKSNNTAAGAVSSTKKRILYTDVFLLFSPLITIIPHHLISKCRISMCRIALRFVVSYAQCGRPLQRIFPRFNF